MSWAAQYIGLPWEAGAQGPDAYDCMGFFRMIQGRHFGIKVPVIIAPDYEDGAALAGLFCGHEERGRWPPVAAPQHGDAVIIHKPLHIGTWLDVDGGGVLHCTRGIGVIFTQDASWRLSGFGRKEHFRFTGKP
jgi:hypothetical protein